MKIAVNFENLLVVALAGSASVDAFSLRPETTTTKAAWKDAIGKAVASGFVAASIWSAPSLPFVPAEMQSVAVAKEKASGSGSRVNKDADSLLRYGLPIKNKEVSRVCCWHFVVWFYMSP